MTLVYRSIFADPGHAIGSQVDRLFGEWLATKALEVPEDGLTARGVGLLSAEGDIAWAQRREIVTASTDVIRRLRLVEESDAGRWATTIVWSQGSGEGHRADESSWVWVDLEHEPMGDQPLRRPGSPRVVREMLATGEAHDSRVPLTSEPWLITEQHVDELVGYVREPGRHVPVIVFAHDGQHAYDQARLARDLARDLAGVAVVYRLDGGASTERFAGSMPEGYAVYGGAMRTFLPGALGEQDLATRHRVLGRQSLVALGARAFPAVKDQILELSTTRPAPFSARPPRRRTPRAADPSTSTTRTEPIPVGIEWVRPRLNRLLSKLGLPVVSEDRSSVDRLDKGFEDVLGRMGEPATAVRADSHPDQALAEAEAAANEARLQSDLLEQLLEDADRESKQTLEQLDRSRSELEDLQLEATEAAELADRHERRARWLERRLREAGDFVSVQEDALPPPPPSVAETVALARHHLGSLHLCDLDAAAAALDVHAGAQLYAIKTWAALIALNAFAEASVTGRFVGSFYSWCQTPPDGEPAISATVVAMTESEQVLQNPQWRDARIFQVPGSISPAKHLFMPAHVKIVKRGAPAPRLHFSDETSTIGKVVIGYIGEHLPTAQFH